MKWGERLYRLFLIWYGCGLVLVGFHLLPPWLEWANVVFLMLAGMIGALFLIERYGQRGIIATIAIFIGTMAVEYVGATYSLIFGSYDYTNQFGMTIFGVPIAIGFAWLAVIGCTHALALRFVSQTSPIVASVVGASLAVVLDLVIDPVAYVAKQYWLWEGTSIYYNVPLQNFAGWFVVAFVIHLLLFVLPGRKASSERRAMILFFLLEAMFLFLALLEQLYVAFLLGVSFATFIFWKWRRST
ncbi:putative membrane protein [Anoxybacillus tengchongensis]|uniref:Putative membrane protein n=1 Tax=Anoxybacillus tengchongensis TaxID=576944 RepID=A0A7X0D9F1_9BACL|nr:carotenoid biosynthesis protein [Anoxybacillus tengchongensis]MBB6176672.1 putative membrane protein [Anoxybacillus tengchongensis]